MITIEEMKNLILYKKPFFAPFVDKDNKHGSLIYLLANSSLSSMRLMNNPLMINRKYFESYYIEKDITYYINSEGYLIEADDIPYNVISESKKEYLNDPNRFVSALNLENLSYEGNNFDLESVNESITIKDVNLHDLKSVKNYLKRLGYNTKAIIEFILVLIASPIFVGTSIFMVAYSYLIAACAINFAKAKITPDQAIEIRNTVIDELNQRVKELNKNESKNKNQIKEIESVIEEIKKKDIITNEANLDPVKLFNDLDKDIYLDDINNISQGYGGLSKNAIDDLNDVIVRQANFYFNKISRNWSSFKKEKMSPFNKRQYINIDFAKVYLNYSSSKCILPKDGLNKFHSLSIVYIENNDKIYTAILETGKGKLYHAWIFIGKELINIDQFISGYIVEEVISEDIESQNNSDLIRLKINNESSVNDFFIQNENCIMIFRDSLDMINEAAKEDQMLYKLLYKERLKKNKEVFDLYDDMYKECDFIKYTYIDLKKYKKRNLFYDLTFYNQSFFKNNFYTKDRGAKLYFEFLNRFFNDNRFDQLGYTRRTIFIPVDDYIIDNEKLNYTKDINPISVILRLLKTDFELLQNEWRYVDFLFFTNKMYFKVNFSSCTEKDRQKFITLLNKVLRSEELPADDVKEKPESTKAIVHNITDKIEKNTGIKVYNLTGDETDISKKELQDKIEKAAEKSSNTDNALDQLEKDNYDEYIKGLIDTVKTEDEPINLNNARAARCNKLQEEFLKKTIKGKSVKDMIETPDKIEELPVTSLSIESPNEDWKNLQYINFNKVYDLDSDIVAILNSFSSKTMPVMVRNIDVQDTSTTEDYVETWKVDWEDAKGNRFSTKLDIPKLIDNKFMMLRGNKKTINAQEFLLPISKTDIDTVQIVSNYNKIFIRRYGSSVPGKMTVSSDLLLKALAKGADKYGITIIYGDNSTICDKYELPIDYIDIASKINKIETKKYIFYFNQDEVRSLYNGKINEKSEIPIGYDKNKKQVLYYDGDGEVTTRILIQIAGEYPELQSEIINQLKASNKYTYSKASILNTTIPLIVIMGYNEGLTAALNKANIKYEFQEKRPSYSGIEALNYSYIRFKDAYLIYEVNLASSLLMNGLKECNTEDYSVQDINTKAMFLDFISIFGNRFLSDGLDNFYDLMIDPITKEVMHDYKLPEDYIELCGYANMLLADNKYIDHTDLSSNRYRSNEIIAGYVYKALSESYGDYRNMIKRTGKGNMSIKQSKVIDLILLDPTASDASILNPLLEAETINAVSFKGLSGMNSDRSYGLDKRTYSDSMLNVLAMSTGFAGNVGITRQTTIDMGIVGKRGYIKQSNNKLNDMSITKTFGITEAMIPYGSTHDDPFRQAMGFIQNSKHAMRTNISSPLLISYGADQALPYLITNTFAFKSKQDGKVIEKTDNYMVIEYKDKTKDFVDLRDVVKKNSSAGFYTSIQLHTDYSVGKTFKAGEILAYDKYSFSDKIGHSSNIAYNAGILAMVALINTDEGFEDSGIATEWLSEAAASYVIIEKDISLSKDSNILYMVKKGQKVEEGDTLLLFQNSYDDDDVNTLLKTLADDMEDINDLGKIPVKSKYTGTIKDIKIYRTVEKEELSESLRKKCNELEKESSDLMKVAKKNGINFVEGLNANYKLDQTGKVKNVDNGVLIEIYIEYFDKLSVGDKMILSTANKMVTKDILPLGKEPSRRFDPINKVDAYGSIGSTSARMVTSIENTVSCNKVVFYMDDVIKKKAGIKNKSLHDKLKK